MPVATIKSSFNEYEVFMSKIRVALDERNNKWYILLTAFCTGLTGDINILDRPEFRS